MMSQAISNQRTMHSASSHTRALADVLSQRSRTAVREQRRREIIWAWLSGIALILCWDAALRLDERVSLPRSRIGHAVGGEAQLQTVEQVDP